jgi:outer membrane protein TolC
MWNKLRANQVLVSTDEAQSVTYLLTKSRRGFGIGYLSCYRSEKDASWVEKTLLEVVPIERKAVDRLKFLMTRQLRTWPFARLGKTKVLLSILLLMGAVTSTPSNAQEQEPPVAASITIGVVRDGPAADEDIVSLIESELSKHVPAGTVVRFKDTPEFNAGWNINRVAEVLQNALADPEVDIILADDLYSTLEAAKEDVVLTKPVVSTFLQRADLFRLPYSEGDRSLKDNLSFTVIPQRVQTDLQTFQEMLHFQSLHVVISSDDMELVPGLAAGLDELEKTLGVDIRFLLVGDDANDVISSLDESVEAAYLTRMPRLTRTGRQDIIEAFTRRGVPTFSLVGHTDVDLGALAALLPDPDGQLTRRIALNLSRLIRGRSVSDLPVLLSVDSRLYINGETAAAVGYSPNLETLLYAQVLNVEALSDVGAEPLGFAEALEKAEISNTFLSIQDELVESVRQDQDRTRSVLLPQVLTDLKYRRTNVGDRLKGVVPEDAAFFGLGIRQMIFDDFAISNYRASKRLYEGSEFEREAERIETLANAGYTYLGLGLTQAIYQVEVDNLRLTEANLEIARLRRDVGYSGLDEIYRWESEVAGSQSALFTANEDVEAARITLNQILGVEQNRRWKLEEIPVDVETFPFLDGRLEPIFDELNELQELREVLVQFAIENGPEIKAFDKRIESLDIQVGQLERRFYVPSAFLDFSYDYQLAGTGDLPSDSKDFYFLHIGAEYPIFEGARKLADVRKAQADRRALERQRQFIAELIEQETRIALRRCENSFPKIRFTRQAAEAAANNLGIVQDKYTEGIVDVTELISAQNQRLTADQFAAAAVYD